MVTVTGGKLVSDLRSFLLQFFFYNTFMISGGAHPVVRGSTPVLFKKRFNIGRPDCNENGHSGFSRYEFELVEKNGFVLVHYVGNHEL